MIFYYTDELFSKLSHCQYLLVHKYFLPNYLLTKDFVADIKGRVFSETHIYLLQTVVHQIYCILTIYSSCKTLNSLKKKKKNHILRCFFCGSSFCCSGLFQETGVLKVTGLVISNFHGHTIFIFNMQKYTGVSLHPRCFQQQTY